MLSDLLIPSASDVTVRHRRSSACWTPGLTAAPEGIQPLFGMGEPAVMALLECPLCCLRLDASAKVLPCQHTFCAPCLHRHRAVHAPSPLFCPDCRAPVPARSVDDLPANLLLVRLLEGLQGSPGPPGDRGKQRARYSVPPSRAEATLREGQQHHVETQQTEVSVPSHLYQPVY